MCFMPKRVDGGSVKGHIRVTDEKIIKEFQNGKFLKQICKEWYVGIHRVRKVVREFLRQENHIIMHNEAQF
jgi:hypothetical protein